MVGNSETTHLPVQGNYGEGEGRNRVRGSLSGGRQILALRVYALQKDDQDNVRNLLDSIALDGRIASTGDGMVFNKALKIIIAPVTNSWR